MMGGHDSLTVARRPAFLVGRDQEGGAQSKSLRHHIMTEIHLTLCLSIHLGISKWICNYPNRDRVSESGVTTAGISPLGQIVRTDALAILTPLA